MGLINKFRRRYKQKFKGEKKQMINLTNTNKTAKFSTTKITSAAIAIFLIAIMAGSLACVPPAHAAPPIVIVYHTSYVYVEASPAQPAVIGVGQEEMLVLWTADIPPDIGETQGIAPSSAYIGGPSEYRAFWFGESFNVTDPNGVTTNFPLEEVIQLEAAILRTRPQWSAHTQLYLSSPQSGKTAL